MANTWGYLPLVGMGSIVTDHVAGHQIMGLGSTSTLKVFLLLDGPELNTSLFKYMVIKGSDPFQITFKLSDASLEQYVNSTMTRFTWDIEDHGNGGNLFSTDGAQIQVNFY